MLGIKPSATLERRAAGTPSRLVKNWPAAKKEALAELLFSTDTLSDGTPKGIGLSAWRFNVGAGSAEQGDSSGIFDPTHRVECFLDENGHYDWNKQLGYQWFLKKAVVYQVADLIAFVNSPPVFFNQNMLGFKTNPDLHANLRTDCYDDYARFLSTVMQHFDSQGVHFNYISPVNEPQWDWNYPFGKAKQEGSPFTNEEIYRVTAAIDHEFSVDGLATKVIIPEGAMLNHLTDSNVVASNQILKFWNPQSPFYMGRFGHVFRGVAGHSYFTEVGDEALISFREKLAAMTAQCGLEYWQSEYCLLGEGYKEDAQNRSSFDCGMFLAKVIHHDLTVGNATVWHYWNVFEPGNNKADTRYFLFGIQPSADWSDGTFDISGNYYALGHYSRFVRPGMQRIAVECSDHLSTLKAASSLMVSAFINPQTNQLVIVCINYANSDMVINLNGGQDPQHVIFKQYVTNAQNHLKCEGITRGSKILLTGRSISTFVSE